MSDSDSSVGAMPPEPGEMQELLRAIASWRVVHRPTTAGAFSARVLAARRALRRLEIDLARRAATPATEGLDDSIPQELRANSRQLRSAINAVSACPRVVGELPRVVLSEHEDEPRVAAIAAIYLRDVDGNFSVSTLRAFIQAFQSHDPLNVDELWYIPAFLKFILLESVLDMARTRLRSPNSANPHDVSIRLKSLASLGKIDWAPLIEPFIVFDAALRQDPAGAYASMDFDSRELYRKRVAYISRHSDFTECQVAQAALDLAQEGAQHSSDDPRIRSRRMHVGYYLIDRGFSQLAARVEFNPRLIDRVRMFIRAHADDFYITGIECIAILFIAAILFPLVPDYAVFTSLATVLALILLPVTQCAVDLVNSSVSAIFDPEPLPKLDFSKGVPPECTTLVVVPTLLLNEDQVRELVADLEIRFLANRDPHVHFALLTDLPDSVTKPRALDSHPLVELAVQLISELNARYASPRSGTFILLHRHRIFNGRQGVWMGWERKRGKLLDLNKLLNGGFDAFPIKAGDLGALSQVRYVLTVDSDTQLPRESAARLIGAIAHPLNQAVIHPKLRVVVAGYGILQPRVGVSIRSASRSRMAAIYSGPSGFDIYTRAISDAYQDLYGEGSFTGKGIYEAATFHAVFDHRFPRNSLLSHDLIEGAYARAGLATDIELIDDYPSHWRAYCRRKHRWVRGDWQIAQWMFSRVPDESGRRVQSPISTISRWKIFDNLRRSLVEPCTFILFVAGWLGLPGGPLYWTTVTLILLIFPALVQLSFGLVRGMASGHAGSVGEALAGFRKAAFVTLFSLVFLPYQALLSVDAIVRALVRRFITGERLLEWQTAAQAEFLPIGRATADNYLAFAPLVALFISIPVYFANMHNKAALVAVPILILWGLANRVAAWLDARPNELQKPIGPSEEAFLLGHSLRIWRYFCQFGGERHNYLIPDNVEEDGFYEAARVSPTNIGLLLNARQAACELGFLTVPEFVNLTDRSLAAIAKLEKYRGHLYNWYDTQTLKSLGESPFVSSVDSGNFVASLYALRGGALELVKQPLLTRQLFNGLRTHWRLMLLQKEMPASLAKFSLPRTNASVLEWASWLPSGLAALSACESTFTQSAGGENHWWLDETLRRIKAIRTLLCDYMPWLLPEFAPLHELPELAIDAQVQTLCIEDAATIARSLEANLACVSELPSSNPSQSALREQLRASLPGATQNLLTLAKALRGTAEQASRLADETEFAFLIDPDRHILSVGYDVRMQKLNDSCYDMLASEARIATFLAIARDELPQNSWFKLGRGHTRAFGRFVLLSWTGTMFEYLMPALWMRSYPETLISRTLTACVQVQRSFARTLKIPWGVSESALSRKDDAGHYGYQAFGVPQIALSLGASAGPVVSPYSTFLALGVESRAALSNLRRMASDGWVGPYGFYEAADYTSSPGKAVLVREWMAHHQGMSLLAILNLLHNGAMQRWFHANPMIQATELLLHEMPVSKGALKARLGE